MCECVCVCVCVCERERTKDSEYVCSSLFTYIIHHDAQPSLISGVRGEVLITIPLMVIN